MEFGLTDELPRRARRLLISDFFGMICLNLVSLSLAVALVC